MQSQDFVSLLEPMYMGEAIEGAAVSENGDWLSMGGVQYRKNTSIPGLGPFLGAQRWRKRAGSGAWIEGYGLVIRDQHDHPINLIMLDANYPSCELETYIVGSAIYRVALHNRRFEERERDIFLAGSEERERELAARLERRVETAIGLDPHRDERRRERSLRDPVDRASVDVVAIFRGQHIEAIRDEPKCRLLRSQGLFVHSVRSGFGG